MKPAISTAILLVCLSARVLAHPGHDHAPEPGETGADRGTVVISAAQAANLGLQTDKARIAAMAPVLEVPAVLVLPPERHARITAPFAGRVTELMAKLGDEVKKGQPLLRVTPWAVGSPPQELRAAIDGVVFEQSAVIGFSFTAETTLMQTGDYSELLARGNFYQSPELTQIANGQKAVLLLDVFPGDRFVGSVQRVDPGHEEGSPFFHIYALMPNPEGKLRPNYRARMLVETGPAESVVAVPGSAVLGRLGEKFVFVETEPLHFERRAVVPGRTSGGLLEIAGGLQDGEIIVTSGHYQLQYVPTGHDDTMPGDEHGHAH